MTDDARIARVRTALVKIGPLRETLISWPNYLFPSPARYISKADCSSAIKSFAKILSALKNQRTAFNELPPTAAQVTPFTDERFIEEIKMVLRLLKEAEFERKEIWRTGRGRGKNARAHYIAEYVAIYFVHAKLTKPTTGHNDGKPSTLFGRTVSEIYKIVGIDADFRGPCEQAANAITEEMIADARRLRRYHGAVALRASGSVAFEPTLVGNAGQMENPAES